MLDDLACDLGLGPVEDEVQSEKRYDEYCGLEADVIDQAKKQFGQNMMGNMVWAVVSFSPQVGVEVEFFGDRPHTADGDPSNWPKWFRVYEGNINGGDSILTDARGMGIR
jgi:hypothetical protein